jgi:hypothetical protein
LDRCGQPDLKQKRQLVRELKETDSGAAGELAGEFTDAVAAAAAVVEPVARCLSPRSVRER